MKATLLVFVGQNKNFAWELVLTTACTLAILRDSVSPW